MTDKPRIDKAQIDQLYAAGILSEDAYHAALERWQAQQISTGDRGIASQTITGSQVATGDNPRLIKSGTYIENQTVNPPPPDPALAAHTRYLDALCQRHNIVPLAALGGDEEVGDETIKLEQVYIDLDTTTQVATKGDEKAEGVAFAGAVLRSEGKSRPLTALEATVHYPKLALLGDPGSGKSTFVRQLLVRLALARLGRGELPAGWTTAPLPLLLVLNQLTPALAALSLDGLSTAAQEDALVATVRQAWLAQLAECGATAWQAALDDALHSGGVLLIFDGLDEVAEGLRRRVRQTVRAVCRRYPQIRQVIITCRVRSYVGDAVLSEFSAHTLAPFSQEQIKRFIVGWYGAQASLQRYTVGKANAAAADLQRAVVAGQLHELAANPMLLTTMALIHQREVGLPGERVRLYDLAVGVLLSRWQLHKGGLDPTTVSPAFAALLRDDLKLRRVLEQLAYRAHSQQAAGQGDLLLTRGELLTLLEKPEYLGDLGLAAHFLDYIDQRAGLLVGHGGADDGTTQPHAYSFPHRTFQEYLAGCQLVQGRNRVREFRRRAQEADFWYLAAQLGVEELLYNRGNDIETVLDLAYELCPQQTPRQPHGWRALLWSGHCARVVGKAAIERDTDDPDIGPAFLTRLRRGLLGIMRHSPLTPAERADAGRMLGVLGDPRVEVLDPLQIEWCEVGAGPFLMGDDEGEDNAKPQHLVEIGYPYKISRYPITNAQYQHFVDAGGYANAAYWKEAIAHERWNDGKVKRRYVKENRLVDEWANVPADYGEPLTLPNHPVVGVSWYEALAFARWLTVQLHTAVSLPADWVITLPSEAEWEKAARGSSTSSGTARRYPWGDTLTPNHANLQASGIGHSSAVGSFPLGSSSFGVEELFGNVWEWTRSLWGKNLNLDFPYPYIADDGREDLMASNGTARILRGDSSYSDGAAGCARRGWVDPHYGFDGRGFRIVASPSTSGL